MDFKTFFLNNKYSKWYCNIVKTASNKNRKKNKIIYYENHHILPKSIFTEYKNLSGNKWNSVLLTPREHYICHLLLFKMFKEIKHIRKMQNAMIRFKNGNKAVLSTILIFSSNKR